MTATVELRLQGAMDHLRLAWQAGETLLANVPFEHDPEGTRYNILLAIQELITNVFRHGYGGDETRVLELQLEASDDSFAFELRDQGSPFDPVDHVSEKMMISGEEPPAEPGGYGIVIVKMVMDDLTYDRNGPWNIVRATRSISSGLSVSSSSDSV